MIPACLSLRSLPGLWEAVWFSEEGNQDHKLGQRAAV